MAALKSSIYLSLVILVLLANASAQSRTATIETVTNVGLRTFDAAQSCYWLNRGSRWRETSLPTQSCGGVVAFDAGYAAGSFFLDRLLRNHGHERWAHFQIVSAAGAGVGISYTFTHAR